MIKRRGRRVFVELAKQKKLTFTSDIDMSAWVAVNKPYFHSALWNLRDNAYKFTSEGGTVTLKAAKVADELQISISDTGIGIDADEIPKLFTKFHRATDTLAYDYEGTGIGLYNKTY